MVHKALLCPISLIGVFAPWVKGLLIFFPTHLRPFILFTGPKLSVKEESLTYQVVFFLNFLSCYFLMKILSWIITAPSRRNTSLAKFLTTPYMSVRSLQRKKKGRPANYFLHFLFFAILTALSILAARHFLLPLNYLETLLVAPVIYFVIEGAAALAQLIFFPLIGSSDPIHHHPLLARSLSQFWGHNWNLWVQDWLKDMAKVFSRRHPLGKILVTFLFSGLFHEAMVNLPYWLVYKKSYFGTMMLYFIIQSGALWIDKRFVRSLHPAIRRSYLWLMVLIPSPLFVNVPLLTFLGLVNE